MKQNAVSISPSIGQQLHAVCEVNIFGVMYSEWGWLDDCVCTSLMCFVHAFASIKSVSVKYCKLPLYYTPPSFLSYEEAGSASVRHSFDY